MANRSGTNQFGGFSSEPAYGEVKRTSELERSAPMSGAPIASAGKNAPRRAQRRAARSGSAEPPASTGALAAAGPVPTPDAEVLAVGQMLAGHPEASDTLRQIVQQGT